MDEIKLKIAALLKEQQLLEQKLNSSELKAENSAVNFTDLVDDDVA